ncbi:MAG: hypothetical protein COA78_38025 [Blastopirellula sp.]|nr:MAG: hypothetical protein COA78_38025 [Blastopirellula sp.]
MPSKSKIRVKIEGAPALEGFARLDHFASVLQTIKKCLSGFESCITNSSKKAKYRITGLEIGSAIAEIEPAVDEYAKKISFPAIRLFNTTVKALQDGSSIDDRIQDDLLSDLRKLAKPIRDDAARIYLSETQLTNKFSENIDNLLAPDFVSIGTVKGRLEDIITHEKVPFFKLYPLLGKNNTFVKCYFPDQLFYQVKNTIRHSAKIEGTLKYKEHALYPYQAEVTSLVKLKSNKELPKLSSLYGVLYEPNQPDSSEFIRQLRND